MSYNFLRDARTIKNSCMCKHDSLAGYSSDFHVNGDVDGWDLYYNTYLYGCWNGVLFGTSYDRYLYISRTNPFSSIEAEIYYYIKIMMKVTNNNTNKTVSGLTKGKIRWTTISDDVWSSDKEIEFDVIADDKWRLYTINVGPERYWVGYINNLRVYPFIDGWEKDQFAIKSIRITSMDSYKCSNTQCLYYTQYIHPCPGAGVRGSCEAGVGKELYTTISGISDELVVNIDDYGDEIFTLGNNENLNGIEMAKVLSNKISSLNIGGYSYVEVEYSDNDKLKIISGTTGTNSSVLISSSAAEQLGFNSASVKISGTEPEDGFDYASSRLLTAFEINKLIDGNKTDFAYIHNPTQYNVEGGRRDFSDIGTGNFTSDIQGNEYYSSLSNKGKILIDLSHPIDNNGRINSIYVYGKIYSNAKIKICRPHSNGEFTVVHSVDFPQEDSNDMYTVHPINYRIDCNLLVNKGDYIGIYDCDLYVGKSVTGLPDATYCQYNSEPSGLFNPGQPYSFGVGGFSIYVRSDRWQVNTSLDIDLGDRINIEEMNVYGQERVGYFEFNIASCLDVNWDVELFGGTHTHAGIRWTDGQPFSNEHTNYARGTECLSDMIITCDNGYAGDSLESSAGDHSYFYVTGDAEWLYDFTCDGKHEYCWPYTPNDPPRVYGYDYDPVQFTLLFPNNRSANIHKSTMYFKERNNFRTFQLSYFLGNYNATGNDRYNPYYNLIPKYNSISLDGLFFDETNNELMRDYIFENPTNQRNITDTDVWKAANYTDWTTIEHDFDEVECQGFRIRCDEHYSTKIMELELYSKVTTDASLLDNITLMFSDYGDVWKEVSFEDVTTDKIAAFMGGAPRYLLLEINSSTEFNLNELELLVGDQLKLDECVDGVLLEDSKTGVVNQATTLVLENIYDKPFDLTVDIPRETYDSSGLLFWSKLESIEDVQAPGVGPACRLYKSDDYEIKNNNGQCAINVPCYGLKNLIDGKKAYFYNSCGYWESYSTLNYYDTTDIALDKSAIAENSQGGHGPERAIDGDTSTDWGSGQGVPVWWKVDIGEEKLIERIRVKFSGSNYAYTIYGSTNDVDWDIIAVTTFGLHANDIYEYLDMSYRYLKVNVTESDNWASWVNIYDFEVYGPIEESYDDTLVSGTSIDYYNDCGYKETIFTFSAVSSKYWKFVSTNEYSIKHIAAFYNDVQIDIDKVYVHSFSGSTSQSIEATHINGCYIHGDNISNIGIGLLSSDAINKIRMIHSVVDFTNMAVYVSPDNGNNYILWDDDVNTLSIDTNNQNYYTYFAIDLENRHSLDIIRNYGNATNKLFISTSNQVEYSNSDVSGIESVVWDNSDKTDARWMRVKLLCGDGTSRCIRKLGVYPNIDTAYCLGGGYNCEWEPLGNILTDYNFSINIAYGAVVTGTNYYFEDFYPINAVDGISTDYEYQNCWGFQEIDSVDPYIELDFGATYLIDKVMLYHGVDPDNSDYMNTDYTFSVSTSSSGSNFTTVFSKSSNSDYEMTHVFTPTYARRARLIVTGYNTKRIFIYNPDTFEYDVFEGSFLREIEVYTYVDTGHVTSEDWPIVCINLQDQFDTATHELINKDISDTATDWDNDEDFFRYSDNVWDDPKKVSFTTSGTEATVYYSNDSSGDARGSLEYVFGNVYLEIGLYNISCQMYSVGDVGEISLRIEGNDIIDVFAETTAGGSWQDVTGTINVENADTYTIKGRQHLDYTDHWGIRYPYIFRTVGLNKWISVKRNTAENYSWDDDSGKYGEDYLSKIKVFAQTKHKPTMYHWWWDSTLSELDNDYMKVKTDIRSLKIDYPTSSGTDTVILREGDDFGIDIYWSVKDLLSFWLYIDNVNKMDISFGDISFGIMNDTIKAYYVWNISNLSLSTGWNKIGLKFEDYDEIYPTIDNSYAVGFMDKVLDFKNNGIEPKSFRLRYRGKGDLFNIYLTDIKIERNYFEDDVKFSKGLCLTHHDFLEIPLNGLTLEKGSIEFWFKPYFDSYGRDVFNVWASRTIFTIVNNNNSLISLIVNAGNWLELISGHIRNDVHTFEETDPAIMLHNFIDGGQIIHISIVWSNDGGFMDNGETLRFYVNGELLYTSKATWDVTDTKNVVMKFGAGGPQTGNIFAYSGGGIFENIKIYDYCKEGFNINEQDIIKDISYTPNEFIEISSNDVNYYGIGASELPLVFEQVLPGNKETIYVRSNKDERFKQSRKTAHLLCEWKTTV